MEVSATTVFKRDDNRFHTDPSLAVVTSGLPLLLMRSGRGQNLSITIENSWSNMVSKEAQVPVKCVNLKVLVCTWYSPVNSRYTYVPDVHRVHTCTCMYI
jgi:hypothetical protein